MEKNIHFCLALLILSTFQLSCGSVKRIRTEQIKDISGRWNDTDARQVAEEMVKDIFQRPWYDDFVTEHDQKPILMVGDVVNKSHEHIEADPFIKDIEREAINSQKVRIITNGTFREKLRSERQDQHYRQQSQLSDESSKDWRKRLGRELGADFMFFGHINSIVDSSDKGKERVVFYQVTLELVDLATGEVVWIGDKKIKKYIKK